MFIAPVFIITNRKKQVKCPFIDKWISKVFNSRTMEYYLAIKRKSTDKCNKTDNP